LATSAARNAKVQKNINNGRGNTYRCRAMENVTLSVKEYKELLRCKRILEFMEEELHGPMFKKEFEEEVARVRGRMAKGEKVSLKSLDELDKAVDGA